MTLRMVAVGVVVAVMACSAEPEPECGPETCSGCCVAGECLPGTQQGLCGSNGAACLNCGASGLTCAAQACVAPPGDGGMDAGVDAGSDPQVFVTFRYDWRKEGGGLCPKFGHAVEECSSVKVMARAEFDLLRLEYASCVVSQDSADGWTIDCRGGCSTVTRQCFDASMQGMVNYSDIECVAPKYAQSGACAWMLP